MDQQPTAPGVYTTSVAAELSGLHPQTLRLYERRGLVEPARTRGGTRRYSPADIDRLGHIEVLTREGVNLEGVRRILELETEVTGLRRQLQQTRRAAVAAVRRVQALYRAVLAPAVPLGEPFTPPTAPMARTEPLALAGRSSTRWPGCAAEPSARTCPGTSISSGLDRR